MPTKKQAKLNTIKSAASRSLICGIKTSAKRIVNDQTATCIPTYKNCAKIPFLNKLFPARYFKVSPKETFATVLSTADLTLHLGYLVIKNNINTATRTQIIILYGSKVC